MLLALAVLVFTACGEGGTQGDAGSAPATAGEGVGGPYAPEAPDSAYRSLHRLAEGVFTYAYARPEDPVTTISFFVVTDHGVLVADGQGSVEETERLIEEIGAVTDRPITHLVMATDHGDHTGGNGAFGEDVVVLAHPATARALAESEGPERTRLPDRTVSERERLTLGERVIDVLFLGRGHTAGDLAVHLPEEGILFLSEAYLDRVFPLMITAYPSEWVDALYLAEAMDAEVYVPGHGIRDSIRTTKADLARYRTAVEQVITEVRRLHDSGLTVDEAVERANFGALSRQADYVYQAERAVRRVWAELEGTLPDG